MDAKSIRCWNRAQEMAVWCQRNVVRWMGRNRTVGVGCRPYSMTVRTVGRQRLYGVVPAEDCKVMGPYGVCERGTNDGARQWPYNKGECSTE